MERLRRVKYARLDTGHVRSEIGVASSMQRGSEGLAGSLTRGLSGLRRNGIRGLRQELCPTVR